jgi:hypothetical protein
MTERDAIFRERLLALMTALNGGEAKDPALRRLVGTFALRLTRQANAKNWTDLKNRVDPPTYDSMLRLFQRESEDFQKKQDSKGVRALEALAISLIARHQQQADLVPGVGFLDGYIEDCAAMASKATAKPTLTMRPTAH